MGEIVEAMDRAIERKAAIMSNPDLFPEGRMDEAEGRAVERLHNQGFDLMEEDLDEAKAVVRGAFDVALGEGDVGDPIGAREFAVQLWSDGLVVGLMLAELRAKTDHEEEAGEPVPETDMSLSALKERYERTLGTGALIDYKDRLEEAMDHCVARLLRVTSVADHCLGILELMGESAEGTIAAFDPKAKGTLVADRAVLDADGLKREEQE